VRWAIFGDWIESAIKKRGLRACLRVVLDELVLQLIDLIFWKDNSLCQRMSVRGYFTIQRLSDEKLTTTVKHLHQLMNRVV
jgi:hypothetical protein